VVASSSSSACWLFASSLLALAGCEPLASSPPERTAPPPEPTAGPPCLAQTRPILAHAGMLGRPQLLAMDATGSLSIALNRGSFVYGSTWSPDGRTIALRRRVDSAGLDSLATTELLLFSPDDSDEEVVLLTDSAPQVDGISRRHPDGASWSPDGHRLVFASLRDSDHYRIWLMARSGGQAQLLLPELEPVVQLYPRWSPRDAERVAYIAESDGQADLWLADLVSGRRERLTSGEMAALESPRWSPEGERLTFSALPRDRPPEQAHYDIYLLDLGTRERRQITENAGNNFDPAWSPDGTSLLISSTREFGDDGGVPRADLWRVWLDGDRAPEPLIRGVRGASTLEADWYGFAECSSSGG